MKLSEIYSNPNNPRLIKDERFKILVKSIQEFPKMMDLRPIIVDSYGMIIGGNMRFKALRELKYKDVPESWIKKADQLTEEEKKRFIIADNVGFGEHDFDILTNEWDLDQLNDWGLEINTEEELEEKGKIEKKEIKSFQKTHILLSFSPEKMIEIQDMLQKIKDIEGIEYEQASN
jgi:ParB-like chromosome segregation protein Spo0J